MFTKTKTLSLLAAACLTGACAQTPVNTVETTAPQAQAQTAVPQGGRNRPEQRRLSPAEVEALLPAGSRVVRDLTVKQAGAHTLKLDLYLPARQNRAAPVVVWVHGGGWRQGQKEDVVRNPRLLNALLSEGYAVAAVGYRVAGQATFPAPIQDVNDAAQYVWQHGAQYHIDPERMAMAGRSAGAHLAGLAAISNHQAPGEFITLADKPGFKIRAFVGFFGPYDLNTLRTDKGQSADAQSAESAMLGATPAAQPQLATRASPVHYVSADTPPVLLLHGTNDRQVPHAQSEQLKKRLDAAGVPNELHITPDARHGDPVFDDKAHVVKVMAFLRRHFPVQ
ncbi:acetyl esterase/lipase [Neisseria sp. HSC-16F19]|nr:alpha/beta hydrolase [Neisseria sp. HSC-16F19]MCP2040241.1 acetyl esterase/lipase [Neisseria sp. HSC-16F19]